jgi:enoyl-CoA hydratase
MPLEPTGANPVRYVEQAGVATITLDRPEARNALGSALVAALDAALTRAEQSPEVAVIVITGSDPVFCAGLDVKEFTATRRPPAGASDVILRVAELSKPTVGAVNGPVMTGGLELVLGLDILIASERARFADTHARVGILPGGGMTARLPRAVGQRLAMEMSFTGRVLDADEALHYGLVTRVVAHDRLSATAQELGETIAAGDPDVLRGLKRLYRASLDGSMADGLRNEIAEREARRARGHQLVPRVDRIRRGEGPGQLRDAELT